MPYLPATRGRGTSCPGFGAAFTTLDAPCMFEVETLTPIGAIGGEGGRALLCCKMITPERLARKATGGRFRGPSVLTLITHGLRTTDKDWLCLLLENPASSEVQQ
jgi:hypothetical protein